MNNVLAHHGIKGQRWGVRRFQNPDGTRTAAGRERYGYSDQKRKEIYESVKKNQQSASNMLGFTANNRDINDAAVELTKRIADVNSKYEAYDRATVNAIKDLKNNQEVKDLVFKSLNNMFVSYDQVDDEELLDFEMSYVMNEYATDVLNKATHKEYSAFEKSINDYYNEARQVTEDLVGEYGDLPVKSLINKKTKSSYKEVVYQTLLTKGGASWVHYLGNHSEMAYQDGDGAEALQKIQDSWLDEWKRSGK